MAPKRTERFLSSLKESYYNEDTLSDAVIICDGQQFKVHRVILSAHSRYFAKQLGGDWKESTERKIKIEDFDASIVEAMLRFMYSFDYSNTYGTSSMVYDAQVYQVADKYDIPALKDHAMNKFRTAITTGWSMDDFPLAITVVYESTPPDDRGLRDLVSETSRKNIDKLLKNDGFSQLLRKTPDFAADLIPLLSNNVSSTIKQYRCNSCDHTFWADFSSGSYYYCPNCGKRYSNWDSYQV